jgi:DNA polymerase-3 subunit gamma/tau
MSLALYRKYRPQTFEEVVGQEPILRTLKNALKLGRLSHAYLFAGTRGSGKTTIARLLAKAVNCDKPVLGLPCGSCESCQRFLENKEVDLIEIDAASNRGIDDIRELREGIKFTPLQAKFKVFIIDEAHMITRDAFNALLKTLEEPPAHAIFILATTEVEKVPPTIVSRCQRFDFKKIIASDVTKLLERIVESENISIDKDALRLITFSAEGSARDAISLLDQALSGNAKHIGAQDVEKLLGHLDQALIEKFIGLLAEKKLPDSISFLNKLLDEGYDLNIFAKMVVQYVRKLLVVKINPELTGHVASDFSSEQQKTLAAMCAKFSLQELQKLANIFLAAQNQVSRISVPILALELAVAEYLQN